MIHIDTAVLKESINEVSEERLQRELRQWLVMGAPPEVAEVWQNYVKKMERRSENYELSRKSAMWTWVIFCMAVCGYVLWDVFSNVAGCMR